MNSKTMYQCWCCRVVGERGRFQLVGEDHLGKKLKWKEGDKLTCWMCGRELDPVVDQIRVEQRDDRPPAEQGELW